MTSLEQTFLHFAGVGTHTERRLWEAGMTSWAKLRDTLSQGHSPFGHGPTGPRATVRSSSNVASWLRSCDDSTEALRQNNLGYFVDLLPPGEHLRVIRDRLDEVLYLDIETTGLSPLHNSITVVGALYRGVFHQWVWPQALDGLRKILREAKLVVTFNGRRFDIPFLQQHVADLVPPAAHVDLRYVAASAGFVGGQKAIEEHLKLTRPASLQGVDGVEAVALWSKAVYGHAQSLKQLLAYNRADCEQMKRITRLLLAEGSGRARSADGHAASSHATLRRAWVRHRPTLERLLAANLGSGHKAARIVGIDLRGNPKNPTGWALCDGSHVTTCVLRSDEEIEDFTLQAKPDLISIDAPLALPRGRRSAFDNSPCRATGGIVRDAERILWRRGIGVYPALIPHMQGLTARGIRLARRFRRKGYSVIESYPGAAQDILGIPRKQRGLDLLAQGLSDFGFKIDKAVTHDELDAVTSAMVGFFYLADEYEGLGAADECFLIVPRWSATKSWHE